jgi:predicted PurR-regulated permease PerM
VRNALALGLLSGLLEFIPVIGPLIGAGTAVIVAFFQQSNYLGLPGWQLALAVLILMIIIQQIENNVLVPKIVGQSLDLHPLVVMVGVFMGSSLAGYFGCNFSCAGCRHTQINRHVCLAQILRFAAIPQHT